MDFNAKGEPRMPLAIDRRSLLGSSGAAIAVALLPRAAWAAAIPAAPVARVAPVTETLYGTAVTDNYRWMEDARDAEWLPFLKGQDAHARAVLASIPGRDAILKRVAALSGDAAITTKVQVAGARTFYEQRPAGADNYQLFVRDAAGTRVLVDPVALGTRDAHVSLDWWNASFDGSHLVYGLSPSGSEESVGQIMVVATGEILPERLPDANFASPAWLADGSGFFHTRLTGPKKSVDRYKNAVALLHKLRTDPATDRRILQRGSDPAVAIAEIEVPVILTTPGSDAALALLINGVQNEVKAFSAPLGDAVADRARWSKVCDTSDNVTGIALLGADLYLLANTGAIRGQVLRTPALKPDLGTAAVALPMGATVVEGITAARDGIYVTIMDGGIERLRRIAPDGRVADVALPFDGSIQAVFTSTDADGAQLWLSGWLNPSAIWQVDAGSLKVADTRLNPLPPIDLSPYEYTRLYATAKDGVRIPVAVLRRKDAPRDGKRPTIVDAYGAYQISQTPSFRARGLAWLDQGGVYAVANVRGGGEYGREWHAAGRKATKSNTWRDLIAACEALIAGGTDLARDAGDQGRLGGRHHRRPGDDRAARAVRRGDRQCRGVEHGTRRVQPQRPGQHPRIWLGHRRGGVPRAAGDGFDAGDQARHQISGGAADHRRDRSARRAVAGRQDDRRAAGGDRRGAADPAARRIRCGTRHRFDARADRRGDRRRVRVRAVAGRRQGIPARLTFADAPLQLAPARQAA